jgi:hypothetical protein
LTPFNTKNILFVFLSCSLPRHYRLFHFPTENELENLDHTHTTSPSHPVFHDVCLVTSNSNELREKETTESINLLKAMGKTGQK